MSRDVQWAVILSSLEAVIKYQELNTHSNFHKTQVKLFPNFLGIPFDSLLISWVANFAHNRVLLKLHALKSLKQAS